MMEGRIECTKNKMRLLLPCEVDHHILSMMRHSVDKMLFESKPKELLIDFSMVEMMDSSAIGLIVGRLEICERIGATLSLTGLSDRTRRLLELGGVTQFSAISIV